MQYVDVALGDRSYQIEVDRGTLPNVGEFARRLNESGRAMVVTDENVRPLCGNLVVEALSASGFDTSTVTIPPGDTAKTLANVEQVYHAMLEAAFDWQSLVVALGGGVVGDLGGFAAATYLRGVPFIQVPTTLLSQVDSSVGGKTGVNLPQGKNLVGSFYQPAGVLIDIALLAALPATEFQSGMAEVIKYGVIYDAEFLEFLETHADELMTQQSDRLIEVVARCCQIKAEVVAEDEREGGRRAILNYGHTFGHAIEAVTKYKRFTHGAAIAIGMVCASQLAEQLGRVTAADTRRQVELLTRCGLPTEFKDLDPDEVVAAMTQDKKRVGDTIRFVLPTRLGHVETVDDVDLEAVRGLLRELAC